jgi:hypothetical protein
MKTFNTPFAPHVLRQPFVAHFLAGTVALIYAWEISGTRYVTTGLQFVAPVAVMLCTHLAWLALVRNLQPGFARLIFQRTLATALWIGGIATIAAVAAPMPAGADSAYPTVDAILMVLACLFMLAIVIGVAALAVYVVAWVATAIFRAFKGPPGPNDPGAGKLHDFGAVALALCAICTASLEGVAPGTTLSGLDRASSTVVVAASRERLWNEIGTATSPEFALPLALRSIPQPVAVIVDEGASLGARRIVRFKGREGEGDLVLKVVRRTDTEAVFEAVSDDSPIAMWVRHKALTFRIDPATTGLLLTVTIDYERQLAPAWFFGPFMRRASYFAVDVLARDTKVRAEQARATRS